MNGRGQGGQHMKRRVFVRALGGAAVSTPLVAQAQPRQVRRVGALILGNTGALDTGFHKVMREGLSKAGYVEGRDVSLDFRSAEGRLDRLPGLAAELVAEKPDVIVALYTPCAHAVQQATRQIPIVAIVANLVETGMIASLARPGGNMTGVSLMAAEAHGKCVELLGDMLPSVRKIAALGNASDPFMNVFLEKVRLSGKATGIEIEVVTVRSPDEIAAAFATIARTGAGALVMQGSLPSRTVADLALAQRLPAATFTRAFAEAGGLMSYGSVSGDALQRSVHFVVSILRGGKPAEMPAEQPTNFELVINARTARALGITVPPTMLARADEVIE
jgi:putative ABC transport system substrate-binding protein